MARLVRPKRVRRAERQNAGAGNWYNAEGFEGFTVFGLQAFISSHAKESARAIVRPKRLAERAYLFYKMGAPAPSEILKWTLAEKFGWTLEYIEGLSMAQIHEYYQLQDAKYKAAK